MRLVRPPFRPPTILVICAVGQAWFPANTAAGDRSPQLEQVERPSEIDDKTWSRLLDFDRKARAHPDLSAKFVQSKYTTILKRPLVSRGTLLARKDCLLWRTEEPYKSSVLINDQSVTVHFPEERRAEVYPLRDADAETLTRLLFRMSAALERFKVTVAPSGARKRMASSTGDRDLIIRMFPSPNTKKSDLRHIDLWLDDRQGLIHRIAITDIDDERTEIELIDVRVGVGLSDADFVQDFDKATRIEYPLGKPSP